MDQDREEEQILRSINNEYSSLVRFVNKTPCNVILYWIDYQGQAVSYGVLSENSYIDIDTFVTHPWIFVDEATGDRYTVRKKDVFFPDPSVIEQWGRTTRTRRTCIFITLPIRTLRELSLKAVKKRLRYDRQAFDLDIPKTLQYELATMLPRSSRHVDDDENATNGQH